MVLHLGGDYIVPVKNIIFILDYKKISENGDTFSFIENFKAEKINKKGQRGRRLRRAGLGAAR